MDETAAMCRELAASAVHFQTCHPHPLTWLDISGLATGGLLILAALALPGVICWRASRPLPAQEN